MIVIVLARPVCEYIIIIVDAQYHEGIGGRVGRVDAYGVSLEVACSIPGQRKLFFHSLGLLELYFIIELIHTIIFI